MSEETIDAFIDITDVICPITFVKVKVALEEIDDGELLEIRLNDGEPLQNVPRSLREEGHLVTSVERRADGTFRVVVRKGGLQ